MGEQGPKLFFKFAWIKAGGVLLLGLLLGCQVSPQPWSGAELYQRLNCWACHDRPGPTSAAAPPLTGLGQRLTVLDLKLQLTRPRQRYPDSRMPSFAFLLPEEQQALLIYLEQK